MVTDQLHAAEHDRHLPVVPSDLPDGIHLVYADDRDRRQVVALEDAAAVDFDRTRPFRKPPAYRGQRNFPGWNRTCLIRVVRIPVGSGVAACWVSDEFPCRLTCSDNRRLPEAVPRPTDKFSYQAAGQAMQGRSGSETVRFFHDDIIGGAAAQSDSPSSSSS